MNRFLTGPPGALGAECRRLTQGKDAVLWLQNGRPRRPWEGLRQLVAQLEDLVGVQRVDEALENHLAAAGLVLPDRQPQSPRQELRAREIEARPYSHLSHNSILQRPFVEDWLEILEDLLDLPQVVLVVPNLADLDSESVWLLRAFLRKRPATFPRFVIGFDPTFKEPPPDGRGIVWGPFQMTLSSFVSSLHRRLESQHVELEGRGPLDDEWPLPPDRLHQDADSRLLEEFLASSGPYGPEMSRAMANLVQWAFSGHAFEAVLHWGLALLDRQPELEPAEAARLHGLVALAAHNRQFRSHGNAVLAETLDRHLRIALELEPSRSAKSPLAYRLAVTLGRRQGRIDEAMEFADLAVETAVPGEHSRPAAAYLEAWGRNIRAYLWMRRGEVARAVEDTETALGRLEQAKTALRQEAPEIRACWERDTLLSWGVLAHNRTALAHLEGDREGLGTWRRRADELVEVFPELELYEVDSWLDFYREIARLDLALDKARRGVELARQEEENLWEYRYLAQVADLTYRLGKPREALEACEEAAQLRAEQGNPPFLAPLHVLHASALGRLGRFEEARGVAGEMLESPDPSPASEVEAHTLLARLAAAQGDAEGAELHANAAIEIALEHGHRDTLLRAAVAAGTASDRIGRPDDAREAFEKALEIAAAGDEGAPSPPAGDFLEAWLGLGLREPVEDSPVLQALRVVPAALKEPETWWRLPSIAGAVDAALSRHPSLRSSPEMAEPLDKLLVAARQRPDTQNVARRLGELR